MKNFAARKMHHELFLKKHLLSNEIKKRNKMVLSLATATNVLYESEVQGCSFLEMHNNVCANDKTIR